MDHRKNIIHRGGNVSGNQLLLKALSANNCPTHFLRNGHQLNTERKTSAKDADQRGLVILPYAETL